MSSAVNTCKDDEAVPTLCGRRDQRESEPCPDLGPEWFRCRLCGRHWFDDELKFTSHTPRKAFDGESRDYFPEL